MQLTQFISASNTLLLKKICLASGLLFIVAGGPYNTPSLPEQKPASTKTSSISVKEGSYRIDTSFILGNINKKKLVAELDSSRLQEKKIVSEIPVFIKAFLDSVSAHKDFDIADRGEQWQAGMLPPLELRDVKVPSRKSLDDSVMVTWLAPKKVPCRQLVYFGMGEHIALMTYFTGGGVLSENIAIIKFSGQKITDFWFDRYSDPISNKPQIIDYLKGIRQFRKSKQTDGC